MWRPTNDHWQFVLPHGSSFVFGNERRLGSKLNKCFLFNELFHSKDQLDYPLISFRLSKHAIVKYWIIQKHWSPKSEKTAHSFSIPNRSEEVSWYITTLGNGTFHWSRRYTGVMESNLRTVENVFGPPLVVQETLWSKRVSILPKPSQRRQLANDFNIKRERDRRKSSNKLN